MRKNHSDSCKTQQKAFSGNAIMEYAVPLTLLLIGAGFIASVFDMEKIMGQYFAQASGSSVSGNSVDTTMMAKGATGGFGVGNGQPGFSNFHGLQGQRFNIVAPSYFAPTGRTGARPTTSGEFVYGLNQSNPLYKTASEAMTANPGSSYISALLSAASATEGMAAGVFQEGFSINNPVVITQYKNSVNSKREASILATTQQQLGAVQGGNLSDAVQDALNTAEQQQQQTDQATWSYIKSSAPATTDNSQALRQAAVCAIFSASCADAQTQAVTTSVENSTSTTLGGASFNSFIIQKQAELEAQAKTGG